MGDVSTELWPPCADHPSQQTLCGLSAGAESILWVLALAALPGKHRRALPVEPPCLHVHVDM